MGESSDNNSYFYNSSDEALSGIGGAWDQFIDYSGDGADMTVALGNELPTDDLQHAFSHHAMVDKQDFSFEFSSSYDPAREPPQSVVSDAISTPATQSLNTSPVIWPQSQNNTLDQIQLPTLDEAPGSTADSNVSITISPADDLTPSSKPIAMKRRKSQTKTPAHHRRRRTTSGASLCDSHHFINFSPGMDALLASTGNNSATKRGRGRIGPLNQDVRKNAALMRKVGACQHCHNKKAKCDAGIHCKPCIEHYRCELIRFPCRGQRLEDLATDFLPASLAWHPRKRLLGAMIGNNYVQIDSKPFFLDINLFFGRPIALLAQIVYVPPVRHRHIVYPFMPSEAPVQPREEVHAVFPAILAQTNRISKDIDTHLSTLIDQCFESFPLYQSPCNILRGVHRYYMNSGKPELLHFALKLLVLIHMSGEADVSMRDYKAVAITNRLLRMPEGSDGIHAKPCFIRGQLGAILPDMARAYLGKILNDLELACLSRSEAQFPTVVATFLVLMMALESGQWKGARDGFHDLMDGKMFNQTQPNTDRESVFDNSFVDRLLEFYQSCFSEQHARLITPKPQPPPSFTFDSKKSNWIASPSRGRHIVAKPSNALSPVVSYLSAGLARNDPWSAYSALAGFPHSAPSAFMSQQSGFGTSPFSFNAPYARSTFPIVPPPVTNDFSFSSDSSFGATPPSATNSFSNYTFAPPAEQATYSTQEAMATPRTMPSQSATVTPESAREELLDHLRTVFANSRGYLTARKDVKVRKGMADSSMFFDRLVARLVVGSC